MARSDIFLGAALFALGCLLWFYLVPAWVVVPGGIQHVYMAPDFWIRVIAGGMLLIGGSLFGLGLSARRHDDEGDAEERGPVLPRLFKLGCGLLLFWLYYAWLDILGIVICSALAIVASALLYGERRFRYLLPIAVLLPVGLYFFFLKVASIPLPVGILSGIGPF